MARSATLAPTAIDCLICDAPNQLDAMVCASCGAPTVLVHDALSQERDPCMITVIGDSNVGKTVYLGVLLDMLSKRAEDFEAIPKGAYSVNLQHSVISYLSARQFPPKTAMEVDEWHWAYYQVTKPRRSDMVFDLIMPDMAGEALAAEVASPQTFTIIRSLLEKSAGLVLLVDAAVAASGSPQPDFFALKLMSYLDATCCTKRKKQIPTPVAVILSKADYCPQAFDDPRAFAKTNLNRLWNICESRCERFEFFAASVVGALGYGSDDSDNVIPFPLHVAPRGVLEPFEWMLNTQ
ncbi:MAG: hypothetical protein ACE5E6_02555 [Phycisphaerae bacterium]